MGEKSNTEEDYIEVDYPENAEKKGSNGLLARFFKGPFWIVLLVALVGVSAFALGKVTVIKEKREPVKVISASIKEVQTASSTQSIDQTASVINSEVTNNDQVVGSKNSNKYHYPWCSGAKRISPENLVTFASLEEARSKGYTPASNCPGLK